MFATNFYEERVLNTLRGVTLPGVSSLFLGLFFNSPGETGSMGVEVNYAGYSRQPITFGVPSDENQGRGFRNTNDILFPLATEDVGTVHAIGISDSITGGNMLLYGHLEVPLPIDAQNRPNIRAGDIAYWLSGTFSNLFKDRILENLRGTAIQGFTPRLGLFNGNPEQGGVELSGQNYARPEVQFSAPVQQPGDYARIANTEVVTFNSPSSPWGMWNTNVILGPVGAGSNVPEAGGQVAPIVIVPAAMSQQIHVNYVVRLEPQNAMVDFN